MQMSLTRPLLASLATCTILLLAACGGDNAHSHTAQPTTSGSGATAPSAGITPTSAMKAFDGSGKVKEIIIHGDDRMKFDIDAFSVSAGAMVTLTLEHTGNLPKQSMGHNVVIIDKGIEYMDFAADAAEGGAKAENHYVPESVLDQVVAYTELIGGGEKASVSFQAPTEPGAYAFLCSFPGHAGLMHGIMTVE